MSEVGQDVPFFEHLIELRHSLIKGLVCIIIVLPFSFYFSDSVLDWFLQTSCPPGTLVHYQHPFEAFIITMKIAFLLAMFVTVPYLAYLVWSFVSPGLYSNERYALSRFAFASWFFFVLGAVFNMLYIFPLGVKFGLSFQTAMLEPQLRLQFLLGMAFKMTLGFGVMFQLPIAVYLLVVTGLVQTETLKKSRPYVIVVILVLSAILTPPDAFSQLMMGLPTYLLFEGGLFFSQFARVRKPMIQPEVEVSSSYYTGDDNLDEKLPVDTTDGDFDDDFDDDYDPNFDHEDWDYDYEKNKAVLAEKRRKRKIRRIRGNR